VVDVREHRGKRGASTCDELFLFFADDPLTDSWKERPKRPMVSDASWSRPAGRIFESQGQLYRSAQDCLKSYGYGLRMNRILHLTETEYDEEGDATGAPRLIIPE
jgi:hypothetical protein